MFAYHNRAVIDGTQGFYFNDASDKKPVLKVQTLTVPSSDQYFEASKMKELVGLVKDLSSKNKKLLVLTKTKPACERVCESLTRKLDMFDGLIMFHNDLVYNLKLIALKKFEAGDYNIAICPQSLASQLQKLSVDVVIHYDMPASLDDFLIQVNRLDTVNNAFFGLNSFQNQRQSILESKYDFCNSIVFTPEKLDSECNYNITQILSSHYDKPTIRKLIKYVFDLLFGSLVSSDGALLSSAEKKEYIEKKIARGQQESSKSKYVTVSIPFDASVQRQLDLSEYEIKNLVASLSVLMPSWFTVSGYFGKKAVLTSTKLGTNKFSLLFCSKYIVNNELDLARYCNQTGADVLDVIEKLNTCAASSGSGSGGFVVSYSENSVYLKISSELLADLLGDNGSEIDESIVEKLDKQAFMVSSTKLDKLVEMYDFFNCLTGIKQCVANDEIGVLKNVRLEQSEASSKIKSYLEGTASNYTCSTPNASTDDALQLPPQSGQINDIKQLEEFYINKCQFIRSKDMIVTDSNYVSDNDCNGCKLDDHTYSSLKTFISQQGTLFSSGKSIARIFHGIGSPSYPVTEWGWTNNFGKFKHVSFCMLSYEAHKLLIKSNFH
ncbi:hypothetical protein AYI69_g4981 [Smittium culicis]|uniref:Helicase C-terminal domain-containing protein n=1 Tax=Smittium culicis TaxID=133412 RepID=A0A1R1Y9A2_9FUNG|nr:hypothetical protein AYI69_g4981 [Smittium culicis]